MSQATQLGRAESWIWNLIRYLWTQCLYFYPQGGNVISRLSVSWPNRLEITGFAGQKSRCAPLDALPTPSKLLGRSRPRRPYLHSAWTSPHQAQLPPRKAAGLRGLRGFRAVRKAHPQRTVVGVNGCQGKVLFLRLKRRPAQRSNLRPRGAPVITGAASVQRRVVVLRTESVVANK